MTSFTDAIADGVLEAQGGIRIEDIIGPGEILELAGGITRPTFKRWRERDFPQPIRTLSNGELWDRRAVAAWLEEHRAT